MNLRNAVLASCAITACLAAAIVVAIVVEAVDDARGYDR